MVVSDSAKDLGVQSPFFITRIFEASLCLMRIYVLICVGLAVDYAAHIAHMFKDLIAFAKLQVGARVRIRHETSFFFLVSAHFSHFVLLQRIFSQSVWPLAREESSGSARERAINAVDRIGVCTFNAVLSTLLAVPGPALSEKKKKQIHPHIEWILVNFFLCRCCIWNLVGFEKRWSL